jgi:predicted alpha/beta hydrolase family esterase
MLTDVRYAIFQHRRIVMATSPNSAAAHVLTVPGLHGSGDAHWQGWIEGQFPCSARVMQQDWSAPALDDWAAEVRSAAAALAAPVIVVAHSFGCLAAVHALRGSAGNVCAALLVAPADPLRFSIDPHTLQACLPVPSVVVGSENDPWLSAAQARGFAQHWGSAFVSLGHAGHINAESGFGPWERGRLLVQTMMDRIQLGTGRRSAAGRRDAGRAYDAAPGARAA